MRLLIITAGLVVATAAYGQSAERQFQSVITSNGDSCPQVTNTKAMGRSESGDNGYIAVACSDGSRHVVEIDMQTQQLGYISSCAIFRHETGQDCF